MKQIYLTLICLLTVTFTFAQLEGTWKLAPQAGAFLVGPTQGSGEWFANSADDITTRACLFDDQFVFNGDGTFQNIQDGSTWLETRQGVGQEECGAPVAPHDGSNAATWADNGDGTFTLTGVGAHVGLAKVTNNGELTDPANAPASVTYIYTIDGNTMTVDINFGNGADGWWRFILAKEVASATLAGTWQLAPQAGAFLVGPTQGSGEWFTNSADDVTTRACLFDDQFVFNGDGTFQNIQDGSTWLETWQGVGQEECGAPVAPHDGSNAATWTDNGDGTFTLTGVGAHVGLAKVTNNGELTDPANAPASVTYIYSIDGNTMTVDINFGAGADGWWRFIFEQTSPVSVQETVVVEDLFSFYPNPANTQIQVETDEYMDAIIIRDITGKPAIYITEPSMNETINVSNLPKGMYIIEARADNKVSVDKLSIH